MAGLDKVKPEHHFLDLSDYARPVARVLTRALAPTPITPIHITLTYTVVGLIAAALYAQGTSLSAAVAGALLIIKSTLDAVDGSLARARSRPSRVGRLLDSILDFVVNAVVFVAIAVPDARATGSPGPLGLAVAALFSATWQGTAFNYYSVAYRQYVGGETTSKLDESVAGGMPWDNPTALRILLAFYAVIYGWQDKWMARLDRLATAGQPPPAAHTDRRFLTAVSVMGLGTQLALVALCSWLGLPMWALYLFVGPLNVYFVALIVYRYTKYRRLSADT